MGRGRSGKATRVWSWWIGAAVATAVLLALPAAECVFCQTDQPAPPSAKAPEAPAGEKKAEGEKREEKPVQMNADLLSYNQPIYTLTGNAHLRQEDADLYCDQAEYDEDKDSARATGHLKMTTPEATVTGDLIVADFGKKVADITGNVRLEAQRKKREPEAKPAGAEAKPTEGATPPQGEEKKGEPTEQKPSRLDEYREKLTVITCEHIQYWYDEKRAIATGNVVAVQEDKTVTADEGVYIQNDQEETLTLTGNPVKLVMKNGNHMETPKVMIDLKTEVIKTGPATGVFKKEKKEETPEGKAEQPAPEPKPETPAPSPAPPTTPKP